MIKYKQLGGYLGRSGRSSLLIFSQEKRRAGYGVALLLVKEDSSHIDNSNESR
ncbi:MAG: hypothetical protein FWH00_00655 [Oscillospiraceae bacterium]|nr:hypothetical protein [Oscillospiraceae bacterium]